MGIGGRPDEVHQDAKTEAAVKLAEKFIKGVKNVTDSDFDPLRALCSEKEIAEICSFIVLISATHQFGSLTDAD